MIHGWSLSIGLFVLLFGHKIDETRCNTVATTTNLTFNDLEIFHPISWPVLSTGQESVMVRNEPAWPLSQSLPMFETTTQFAAIDAG